MNILYEDNHLLVAVKPCGIPTQPAPHGGESLEERLKEHIRIRDQKKGNVFLHAIHRLDKQASGIVIFAKSQKALSRLQESIRQKACKKIYRATVAGTLSQKEATLIHFLVHADHKAIVAPKHPDTKKCILHYKVLEEKEGTTLLEIHLETGRYHQIRCQLAAIGHPIVGDVKYGSTRTFPQGGIALQHFHMEIEHPTKKELLILQLPETT